MVDHCHRDWRPAREAGDDKKKNLGLGIERVKTIRRENKGTHLSVPSSLGIREILRLYLSVLAVRGPDRPRLLKRFKYLAVLEYLVP